MHIKKRNGYIISAVMLLALTLITLFLIFLFMHPTVYFSKASGFSQHDGVRAGKNKLRLVVPETVDTTKSTYISVKQEWFETSRIGRITDIKAKQGKHLALDFTDREYNQEVFTIYTKNWFGIKREHDVIVDYSNFLRVFFPESQDGVAPRKPVILAYSKLQTEYKHIYEELYKMKGFVAFDEKGQASGQPVSKEEVFVKENARGRAFIVNNNTHISLVYDFLLPGIFKNQALKTQVYDLVEKVMGKARTLDPESQGLEIKLNTPPFYISKFLGWYYIDPAGNRVDLKPGQEFLIPQWVKSELRLIAKYDITTDTDKIGPELDKQGLVAASYFDGAERVFFDIVKKGSPLKEHVYQKPGYTYEGWYRDSSLTEKVNFAYEVADAHTVLYLKSVKQNQPQPEKPVQYHTVNFITPSDANQLFSTRRAHGQKLETNYLIPSLVSRLDEHGNLWELDYWTIVDPVTGKDTGIRFDFNTPITEDITLKAVMRKRIPPTSKYTIKRYYESVDQAGNFIEDKSKEEVVENQTPGQEVQLSPTQTNAPTGFKLADGTVTNKKINKDGTTVFELKYTRNRYKVNFEVNYNGNHFKDVNVSQTPEQTVLYEGKVTKPANPTIAKAGYTYTFKHWQLKDEMGNVYKEVSEFDFNTKITYNLTLVAYFEEKKDTATYTVKHIFQGIQNQIDERIEERKFTEQVGKLVTVTQENRDKGFDQHFEVADFSETKKVAADGSTVFEIRYARKKYKVTFEVNYQNHFAGANASSEPAQTIPYQGKVKRPEFAPSLAKAGLTYTFKHWQLKDEMGNIYKEVSAFDFDNTQITKHTTLVAYFEENVQTAKYTIKHIFKGIPEDNITDVEKTVTKNALTNSSVQLTNADKYHDYNENGFDMQLPPAAQTIKADGSTEFTITYVRREFNVTFKVNYNNHFPGTAGNIPDSQKVKFEGKVKQPTNPTITKNGRTYQFKHWQLESSMHGTYSEQQPYNFSSPVQGDISLVAYFKEIIHKVNYKIVHYLEKTGKDNNLNGQYERIEEIKSDQKVEDGATYQDYLALDGQLYEKHTTHHENKLTAQLTAGNNSVEVCQYYKLKEVEVKFKKTEGIASFTYDTLKVKKTRSVVLPGYTLKNTHNFVGWALSQNGQTQSEFVVEKTTKSLEIFALTDFQNRDITYTIKKEKPDGTFEDPITETRSGKISSNHTVNYQNPDDTIYQKPVYDKDSLTVNADSNQNKVVVTIKRKVFEVTFEVKGHNSSIAKRTIRHGAAIGAIDESQFAAQGLGIRKAELDGKEKDKAEIENLVVLKNHKVTLHIGTPTKKFGKYPQTKVENPVGIRKIEDKIHELKFNSKGKDHTMQFTRSYWQDSEGNKYEKYNNQYFKIEPVDFVKIPKLDTWFTEKIIDFSPFNIYYSSYSDNAKPEHSIFKAMVQDIGKVLGGEVYMPTYDTGDFQVKPALDARLYSQLKKESTDYAKAILGNYNGQYTNNYRGTNTQSFLESGGYGPYYYSGYHQHWWLGTQYPDSYPHARSIHSDGSLHYYSVYNVFGVVVCIR